MRLFTSRWQNRELAELRCQPVGISRGIPRFKTGYRYRLLRELAPSEVAWAAEDERAFTEAYIAQLEHIGLQTIMGRMTRISQEAEGAALVLLCFEREDQVCHRHVLRRWLRGHGVEITELHHGDLPQRQAPAELGLFGDHKEQRGDE